MTPMMPTRATTRMTAPMMRASRAGIDSVSLMASKLTFTLVTHSPIPNKRSPITWNKNITSAWKYLHIIIHIKDSGVSMMNKGCIVVLLERAPQAVHLCIVMEACMFEHLNKILQWLLLSHTVCEIICCVLYVHYSERNVFPSLHNIMYMYSQITC